VKRYAHREARIKELKDVKLKEELKQMMMEEKKSAE